ncbi:MAG: glycosyltransferase family 2 protein [Flavobacteriaceae bacterium]|nr:glycosyltransferase family 2 protein [Flavobacteriaceae bacterium]
MRIGSNPYKDSPLKPLPYNHQVIIPVYIPNFEGFFIESFEILKLSLESLFKTIHSNTFITVVNNGSSDEVRDYLDALYKENKINEVIHTGAIGKINAILKGLVGHNFPLVTISDADVLFLNGWQEATYDVFKAFSKAGVVSPVPVFRKQLEFTHPLHFDYFFSKKLQFSAVKNPEAMTLFAKSIGWPRLDEKWKDVILTVTEQNITAVVGAPHFVATYKRELFESIPNLSSDSFLGNKSEQHFFDKTVLKYNAYRLATYENYAYHMGNTLEEWMQEKLNNLISKNPEINVDSIKKLHKSRLSFILKSLLFKKFISINSIKKAYYRYKGLPKNKKNEF